jgi:hypothetical protein
MDEHVPMCELVGQWHEPVFGVVAEEIGRMEMGEDEETLWSFLYFYHMDKANACIHCSPVRFSPLTFRLCDAVMSDWPKDDDIPEAIAEVRSHRQTYELDTGR